jgi:hypothetical protein
MQQGNATEAACGWIRKLAAERFEAVWFLQSDKVEHEQIFATPEQACDWIRAQTPGRSRYFSSVTKREPNGDTPNWAEELLRDQ